MVELISEIMDLASEKYQMFLPQREVDAILDSMEENDYSVEEAVTKYMEASHGI